MTSDIYIFNFCNFLWIGATIRSCCKIQCLQYAGCFGLISSLWKKFRNMVLVQRDWLVGGCSSGCRVQRPSLAKVGKSWAGPCRANPVFPGGVQCTVYCAQCTVYTVQCKVYTVQQGQPSLSGAGAQFSPPNPMKYC